MQNTRIGWIDDLRGFSLCAMILYHAVFNLTDILFVSAPWLSRLMDSTVVETLQTLFVLIFLLLAGICTKLTRNAFLRAFKVFAGALLVTAVTYFAVPENVILWGILHLMAFSMFFYAIFGKLLMRIPPLLGFLFCLLLFIITFSLPAGFLGIANLQISLPASLYKNDMRLILGFAAPSFQSYDYVPVFPYIFMFLCGSFLSRLSLPKWKSHSRFFSYVGRHSLFVYLFHQPVLWGMIWIIERCMP